MKLNRTTRKACGLMGAVAILSIIYYALMIPPLLRRPRPQTDFYGQGVASGFSPWLSFERGVVKPISAVMAGLFTCFFTLGGMEDVGL